MQTGVTIFASVVAWSGLGELGKGGNVNKDRACLVEKSCFK